MPMIDRAASFCIMHSFTVPCVFFLLVCSSSLLVLAAERDGGDDEVLGASSSRNRAQHRWFLAGWSGRDRLLQINTNKQDAGPPERLGSMSATAPGSRPPRCDKKCGRCAPCYAVHVTVPPGTHFVAEYYPEAWRCKCGDRLFMP